MWRSCVLVLTLLVATHSASAERRENDGLVDVACRHCTPKRVSTARRAIATAAAIMPGFLVRGMGSWLVDEKPAAKKLALAGGGGLVVAALAGLLVGGSGGNPYTVPAVPLVVGGAGVFLTTWVADVFAAAGGERVCGQPLALPRYSVELGSTWQRDAYRGRLFGRAAGRVALGRLDVGAATLLHAGGDALLGFADARLRLAGAAATGSEIADGSKLVVRIGGRLQRDAVDRVTQRVAEIEVGGRFDLRRLDRVLHASFVEGSTGVGAVSVRYTDEVSDLAGILLARFAWGVYVPGGELSAYYDHRRDGIAGGIAAGRAAGFVGSVGAIADVAVVGPWAVRGELQFGNAWLTTLALSYRGGGS